MQTFVSGIVELGHTVDHVDLLGHAGREDILGLAFVVRQEDQHLVAVLCLLGRRIRVSEAGEGFTRRSGIEGIPIDQERYGQVNGKDVCRLVVPNSGGTLSVGLRDGRVEDDVALRVELSHGAFSRPAPDGVLIHVDGVIVCNVDTVNLANAFAASTRTDQLIEDQNDVMIFTLSVVVLIHIGDDDGMAITLIRSGPGMVVGAVDPDVIAPDSQITELAVMTLVPAFVSDIHVITDYQISAGIKSSCTRFHAGDQTYQHASVAIHPVVIRHGAVVELHHMRGDVAVIVRSLE